MSGKQFNILTLLTPISKTDTASLVFASGHLCLTEGYLIGKTVDPDQIPVVGANLVDPNQTVADEANTDQTVAVGANTISPDQTVAVGVNPISPDQTVAVGA